MLKESISFCPCGSNTGFNHCCGRFISYQYYPDTAEQLMRARYSAYVLKNEAYLLSSWHESTRPEALELKSDTTQWIKLKIITCRENQVHFVAYYMNSTDKKESVFALYEESEFVKENNQWFYISGKELSSTELSKNKLCPCKSGKKFKRCCAAEM